MLQLLQYLYFTCSSHWYYLTAIQCVSVFQWVLCNITWRAMKFKSNFKNNISAPCVPFSPDSNRKHKNSLGLTVFWCDLWQVVRWWTTWLLVLVVRLSGKPSVPSRPRPPERSGTVYRHASVGHLHSAFSRPFSANKRQTAFAVTDGKTDYDCVSVNCIL